MYNWELHQLDVEDTFSLGDSEEEVYIEQSSGLVAEGETGIVLKLKFLFIWIKIISSWLIWLVMIEFGLLRFIVDLCLNRKSVTCMIVLVI